MSATIIDGKGIADAVLANLREEVSVLGAPVHLAAVCIGDDLGLAAFVKLKQKAAQTVGITFSTYFFAGDNKEEVLDTLRFLAADDSVDGIFVELPLPKGWDLQEIIALIPPEKDVDAFTTTSRVPEPAVRALQYVLTEMHIDVAGVSAVVIGQGRLIGEPVTKWLTKQGAGVAAIDVATVHPEDIARQADLIITGAGVPGLVTDAWVNPKTVVIDFGYAKNVDGKYVGDVDQVSVSQKAKALTPVPGGMGPLVIAAVLENVLSLATAS